MVIFILWHRNRIELEEGVEGGRKGGIAIMCNHDWADDDASASGDRQI